MLHYSSKMRTMNTDQMHNLAHFKQTLQSFSSSRASFKIIHSIPSKPSSITPPRTLYILDSSFNPPTLAHLRIIQNALLHDDHPSLAPPRRVLLLLATQNADKAPKPAAFEQRLAMISVFAKDLLSSLDNNLSTNSTSRYSAQVAGHNEEDIGIDIGLTTLPYFADKAAAISKSGQYGGEETAPTQVHLTGFDTLLRLLDTKYYPPSHTLEPIQGFLAKHRVRVTYRTDNCWGGREEQDKYLNEVGEGKRNADGGRAEWVTDGRIVLCDGRKEGEETVSSTKVREAVKSGDSEVLGKLVTDGVRNYVLEQKLYLED